MTYLPTEIWSEILTYCDNNVEKQIAEMKLDQLKQLSKKADNEIIKRLVRTKCEINCYDIITLKRLNSPNVEEDYAMVVSKANEKFNPLTIMVIILVPSNKNTQYGFYKAKNQHFVAVSRVYLYNVELKLVKYHKDTINNNKLIASSLKVNDVVEITSSLFTSCCAYTCRHYALVKQLWSYNTIEIVLIKTKYDSNGNACICFEGYKKMNTKNVLKHIDLTDLDDEVDNHINDDKPILVSKIKHLEKFVDVMNLMKEIPIIN